MKLLLAASLLVALLYVCHGKEVEKEVETANQDEENSGGWWTSFKQQVKTVLSKWTEDMRQLWNQVLSKATDMRSWTSEMFESFKTKMKEWVESRPDVPEDEKNEIENFISKLRLSTEKPE